MQNKITLFTVNIENNQKIERPLHQLCIMSWERLKSHFESLGYSCEIKIYSYNDAEVLQYKDECRFFVANERDLSKISDGFRVYILSKNKNYIWLDWDLYVPDRPLTVQNEFYLPENFVYISNVGELNTFKGIYEGYKTGRFLGFTDRVVTCLLGVNNKEKIPEDFIHLFQVDNCHGIKGSFCAPKTIGDMEKFKRDHYYMDSGKLCFVFNNPSEEFIKLAHACNIEYLDIRGDKDLMAFCESELWLSF